MMRGKQEKQITMLSALTPEQLVPQDHPIRRIKPIVDRALSELSPTFNRMYADLGRPSIPPEHLLKASLLIALYSIRSERQFCDRRQHLLSEDHFTVDGTLLEAWASLKSLRPKDGGETPKQGERNPDVDFHGEPRANDTHRSSTDPEARLARKGAGKEAKLCFAGPVLMENHNGLVMDVTITRATGTAERDTALGMLEKVPGSQRITVGADKGYDTRDFVTACREMNVTPHVARRKWSIVDERTTRHEGNQFSQRVRKRIEEIWGWVKTVGGGRKLRYKGVERNQLWAELTAAAYNLVRMAKLATI